MPAPGTAPHATTRRRRLDVALFEGSGGTPGRLWFWGLGALVLGITASLAVLIATFSFSGLRFA